MRPDPYPSSRPERSTRLELGWVFGLGLAGLGLLEMLYLFPPDRYAFYPRCLFYAVTGWQCPGCGGLRALHHLLHGHFQTAFALNPLFVVAVPLGLLAGAHCWRTRRATGNWIVPPRNSFWIWLALAGIVLFGIGRNVVSAIF
jgi:hypothetical protein